MKFLVDTHILLWSFTDPERMSPDIRVVLEDEEAQIFYSPISLWEISIKYGLGKLRLDGMSPEEFLTELEQSFFIEKKMDKQTLTSSYQLPRYHKDPFDRMLFWEAIQSDLALLSVDGACDAYLPEGLRVIH